MILRCDVNIVWCENGYVIVIDFFVKKKNNIIVDEYGNKVF